MRRKKVASTSEALPVNSVKVVKPKTKGQAEYIRTIAENDITICHGLAGTGKTACSILLACQHLCEGRFKKIVVARPIVAASVKNMGALPGDVREKIDPYLIPLMEEMVKYFGSHYEVEKLIKERVIELAPLELMRGRTFDDTFMILDEAQNCTYAQLVMFLTRIGHDSKIVINGDTDQSDIKEGPEGLQRCIDKLEGVTGIGVSYLGSADIVRNEIIKRVLGALK